MQSRTSSLGIAGPQPDKLGQFRNKNYQSDTLDLKKEINAYLAHFG